MTTDFGFQLGESEQIISRDLKIALKLAEVHARQSIVTTLSSVITFLYSFPHVFICLVFFCVFLNQFVNRFCFCPVLFFICSVCNHLWSCLFNLHSKLHHNHHHQYHYHHHHYHHKKSIITKIKHLIILKNMSTEIKTQIRNQQHMLCVHFLCSTNIKI